MLEGRAARVEQDAVARMEDFNWAKTAGPEEKEEVLAASNRARAVLGLAPRKELPDTRSRVFAEDFYNLQVALAQGKITPWGAADLITFKHGEAFVVEKWVQLHNSMTLAAAQSGQDLLVPTPPARPEPTGPTLAPSGAAGLAAPAEEAAAKPQAAEGAEIAGKAAAGAPLPAPSARPGQPAGRGMNVRDNLIGLFTPYWKGYEDPAEIRDRIMKRLRDMRQLGITDPVALLLEWQDEASLGLVGGDPESGARRMAQIARHATRLTPRDQVQVVTSALRLSGLQLSEEGVRRIIEAAGASEFLGLPPAEQRAPTAAGPATQAGAKPGAPAAVPQAAFEPKPSGAGAADYYRQFLDSLGGAGFAPGGKAKEPSDFTDPRLRRVAGMIRSGMKPDAAWRTLLSEERLGLSERGVAVREKAAGKAGGGGGRRGGGGGAGRKPGSELTPNEYYKQLEARQKRYDAAEKGYEAAKVGIDEAKIRTARRKMLGAAEDVVVLAESRDQIPRAIRPEILLTVHMRRRLRYIERPGNPTPEEKRIIARSMVRYGAMIGHPLTLREVAERWREMSIRAKPQATKAPPGGPRR